MKLFTVNKDSDDNDVNFLKSLWREVLAEFIGTFMLVVRLSKSSFPMLRITRLRFAADRLLGWSRPSGQPRQYTQLPSGQVVRQHLLGLRCFRWNSLFI